VANQFYMIANDYGLDFYEIHRAMTEKYPRARGFPKAGFAAGPCLFKDTMQLSTFHNNSFFLGHSAMLVNEGLPNYLVRRAARSTTCAADRRHPGHDLQARLRRPARLALVQAQEDAGLRGQGGALRRSLPRAALDPAAEEVIARSGLLFIGTPHSAYKSLDYLGKPVIDIWDAIEDGMTAI
jgi:UDP-N-acetyl-D-mannosaminuronic acid dehydrogenase